jgi:hypothetical protein
MTLTGVNVTSLVQMPQRVCGHSAAFPFEGHPVQRCVLPGVQIQHKLGPALMSCCWGPCMAHTKCSCCRRSQVMLQDAHCNCAEPVLTAWQSHAVMTAGPAGAGGPPPPPPLPTVKVAVPFRGSAGSGQASSTRTATEGLTASSPLVPPAKGTARPYRFSSSTTCSRYCWERWRRFCRQAARLALSVSARCRPEVKE